MSVGPLGFFGSIAAIPAAQREGEADRVGQEEGRQKANDKNNLQAEQAAGIGQTDGEGHDTNERDADGRRPWEATAVANSHSPAAADASPPIRQSKDTTGASGGQLDLTG